MSLYDDLGLPKNASPEEIKKAHRKKAHKAHPDKGGNTASFQVVQHAYDILGDPEKRARYDQSGMEGEQPSTQGMAMQQLAGLFMQIIENCNPESTDLVKRARESILQGEEKRKAHVKALQKKLQKFEKTLKNFSHKGKNDFVANVLNQTILVHKNQIAEAEKVKEVGEEMLRLLKEYKYKFEAGVQYSQVQDPSNFYPSGFFSR